MRIIWHLDQDAVDAARLLDQMWSPQRVARLIDRPPKNRRRFFRDKTYRRGARKYEERCA